MSDPTREDVLQRALGSMELRLDEANQKVARLERELDVITEAHKKLMIANAKQAGSAVERDAGREWLIWSNEHHAWWASNKCGYRLDDREAGRYSLDDAKSICCIRSWERGIPPETMVHESALEFLGRYPNARAALAQPEGKKS